MKNNLKGESGNMLLEILKCVPHFLNNRNVSIIAEKYLDNQALKKLP